MVSEPRAWNAFLSCELVVELTEFFNTTDVTSFTGRGTEPRVEGVEGYLRAEKSRTEAQNVGVIMFTGQSSRRRVVHECGAHTRDLVRRNGDTDAGTTNGDTEFGRSVRDGPAHCGAVVGIVDRGRGVVGTEIDNVVPTFSEGRRDEGLEVVPRVVGAKGDAHCPHATRHLFANG